MINRQIQLLDDIKTALLYGSDPNFNRIQTCSSDDVERIAAVSRTDVRPFASDEAT